MGFHSGEHVFGDFQRKDVQKYTLVSEINEKMSLTGIHLNIQLTVGYSRIDRKT